MISICIILFSYYEYWIICIYRWLYIDRYVCTLTHTFQPTFLSYRYIWVRFKFEDDFILQWTLNFVPKEVPKTLSASIKFRSYLWCPQPKCSHLLPINLVDSFGWLWWTNTSELFLICSSFDMDDWDECRKWTRKSGYKDTQLLDECLMVLRIHLPSFVSYEAVKMLFVQWIHLFWATWFVYRRM